MLQLPKKTRIALIQALKNPSLYAIKIKRAKRFEDKCHNCVTCCAIIIFTSDNEESVTSNFIIIIFKHQHFSDAS